MSIPTPPSVGANSLTTSQTSVTTSVTPLLVTRSSRVGVIIVNITGSAAIYIGNSNVTSSNGHFLPGTSGASVYIPITCPIYAVSASGTQTVSVMEIYN